MVPALFGDVQCPAGTAGPKIDDGHRRHGDRRQRRSLCGLDTHQREELAALYRLGYPRGDEFMIAEPMGQIWLWASTAERFERKDPDTSSPSGPRPAMLGTTSPSVAQDIIDATGRQSRAS